MRRARSGEMRVVRAPRCIGNSLLGQALAPCVPEMNHLATVHMPSRHRYTALHLILHPVNNRTPAPVHKSAPIKHCQRDCLPSAGSLIKITTDRQLPLLPDSRPGKCFWCYDASFCHSDTQITWCSFGHSRPFSQLRRRD
jgi:hypothetical protein